MLAKHKKKLRNEIPSIHRNGKSTKNTNDYGLWKPLKFWKLNELLRKDPDDIVIELAIAQNSLVNSIETNVLQNDEMLVLVQIFAKVSESHCLKNKSRILSFSTNISFLNHLITFLAELFDFGEWERINNTYFRRNSNNIFESLFIFYKNIYHSNCRTRLHILPSLLKVTISAFADCKGISVSRETKAKFRELQQALKKDMAINLKRGDSQTSNDFRELSIFPLWHEVCDPNYTPFIRQNIIMGKYENVQEYLDIHFRLFREDFVTPLRNGIVHHRYPNLGGKFRNQMDVRIHRNVKCVDINILKSCSYVFNLNLRKDDREKLVNSKRFMHGSLVCFTMDNFNTILHGIVSDRNEELLAKGAILVQFESENNINIGDIFTMAENKIYFAPYNYVLSSLKCIDLNNSRMKKYLVDVDVSGHRPDYIQIPSKQNLARKAVRMNLNESQTSAFTAAISNEFVVIQGPPGTGKTFMGLKVAKELLRVINGPLLVISLTNHALDQFLENLLDCTTDLIRVGGQSKNPVLDKFNLKHKRKKTRNSRNNVVTELRNKKAELHSLNNYKLLLENKRNLVLNSKFTSNIQFSEEIHLLKWLFNDQEIPNYILLNFKNTRHMFQFIRKTLQEKIGDATIDVVNLPKDVLNENTTLGRIDRNVFLLEKILEGLNPNEEIHQNLINSTLRCKEIRKVLQKRLEDIDFKSPVEHMNIKLSEATPTHLRWDHYEHALKSELAQTVERIRKEMTTYCAIKAAVDEISNYHDCKIMSNAKVIGMTTTSAARLQSVIHLIKAPVVIIEEAAEILEAHLIGLFGESCKHAILIGDHKQLRPSTNDYALDVDYKLGISLFERMIMNNIQCNTLNVQHRMRPEISRLVCPSIYPNLTNGDNVYKYPDVKGVSKNVFFLTHNNRENGEMDRKANKFEAEYLILLAKHLILSGHSAESISILAAYSGQFREMEKISGRYDTLKSVRISVLDGYQGEENDIILLSLVRNNNAGRIGFLSVENRVCVALSRAKHGLYILGNMDMLSHNSKIWKQIKDVLVDMDSLGETLPLFCQKHKSVTEIKTIREFKKVDGGGCLMPCGDRLDCLHCCQKKCHALPHKGILCEQLMFYELPCGHVVEIPCYMKSENIRCAAKTVKTLPCQHEMEVNCSDDPQADDPIKCPFPCANLIESCGHMCPRSCHIFDDPEHLNVICEMPHTLDGKETTFSKCFGFIKERLYTISLNCFPLCQKRWHNK